MVAVSQQILGKEFGMQGLLENTMDQSLYQILNTMQGLLENTMWDAVSEKILGL